MTVASFLLVVGGFAWTALSMRKHYLQVFGSEPTGRAPLAWRAAGWALLGAALVLCLAHEGISVGIVAWTGLLSVGALLVTLLLTYRPKSIAVLALAAPSCALLLLV